MAESVIICAGCHKQIPDKYFLLCCLCEEAYDIECANVSEKRFINTMTKERKNNWKCPLCCSKTAKTNNSNTPVRQIYDDEVNREVNEIKKRQQRRQAITPVRDDDSLIDIQGDTLIDDSAQKLNLDKNIVVVSREDNQVTLEQINTIIQQNLQLNNKSFITAIQNTIQKEIENALKDLKTDFKQNIENIYSLRVDFSI